MNYLVTHYKNLAEQLQARINHIQRCLYEMDATAGGGIDQLRVSDMQQNDINPVSYQTNTTSTQFTGKENRSPYLPVVPGTGSKYPPTIGDYFRPPLTYDQGPRLEDYDSFSNPSYLQAYGQWLRQREAYDRAVTEHQRYLDRTRPRKTKDR